MTTATYEEAWLAALRPFWHVVARSADVSPGTVVPVRLLGEDLALWRSHDGALALVDDRCPHRGVALSLGEVTRAGELRCGYHWWTFDGNGRCTRIPQLAEGRTLPGALVPSHHVREADGFVWACLADDEPTRPLPAMPELAAGTHWFWMGEPMLWEGQNLRQIENFCDVAHFSVLHLDTFGTVEGIPLEPTRPERDGWRISFSFDTPVCDPSTPAYPGKPTFPGRFEYRVELPCTVHLEGASGPGSVMFIHSTPIDPYRLQLFWGSAFPVGMELDGEAYAAIEDAIWSPDRRMVQSQRPKGLPVDVTAELHLPADRFSVVYRRALAELGVPNPPDARVAVLG
jgi:phenylpropionate dioxygenase-like ring-hydroxylating dioxygenase large terminal subunit